MKLSSCAFALALGLTVLHSATARAEEEDVPPPTVAVHHPSSKAYGAGVALTVTGSVFLAGGLVAGVGGIVLGGNMAGDTGGGLVVAMLGGMIWAGATVVGVATLVPGIVLMAKNSPSREPVFRDAKSDAPPPRFVSVPLLSGTF